MTFLAFRNDHLSKVFRNMKTDKREKIAQSVAGGLGKVLARSGPKNLNRGSTVPLWRSKQHSKGGANQ
jgi:hypothetical protein